MSDVSTAADAPVSDAPVQETAPQEEAAPKTIADAAKGSATPKKPGTAPWSKDLEDLGLDPETLNKVDQYMRDKVQPHTTQLEQKASEYDKLFSKFTTNDGKALDATSAATMASELLDALASDPESAVRDIMQLMQLDPAKFAQVQEQMEEQQADEKTEEDPPELTWVQQQMKAQQEAEQDKAWQDHLEQLRTEKDGTFAEKLYTLAMASVGPDPATAMEWYQNAYDEIADLVGKQNMPKEVSPPSLGEGNVTPPEEPKYGSIKDAVKSYMADSKVANG